MITVTGDRLTFSFPEVERRLEGRLRGFLDTWTPRVLAEDRQAAFAGLLTRHPYNDQDETYLRAARSALDGLTDASVAAAYEAAVWDAAGGKPTERGAVGVSVVFQRTLRLPDDGRDHPLPPGLGAFPLRRIEDLGGTTPAAWKARGGIAMPMYQGEALWLNFSVAYSGAMAGAVKIGAGGINAVHGEAWQGGLHKTPQDYVVVPGQPWLDGFCVEKGVVRQFVAMPLGQGYTAEEQITGEAKQGGVQVGVVPLGDGARFRELEPRLPRGLDAVLPGLLPQPVIPPAPERMYSMAFGPPPPCAAPSAAAPGAMGLGAGGRMKQEIFHDPRPLDDYALDLGEACFVHVLNSQAWRACTGEDPPQPPVTADEYRRYNLPWFDYYRDDARAVEGSGILARIKSVFAIAKEKQSSVFAGDPSLPDLPVVHLGPADRPDSVRGWRGV